MKWYVIYTKARQESRALENLQNQGFDVFLPTCQIQKKQRGKIELTTEPLFSRYLFICLSDVTSNWFPIKSTRGVSSLLRFGMTTEPIQVPEFIIKYLKQRCDNQEPLHELFKQGETLEVTQGPFKGFRGFFEKIQSSPDGLTRALLLVEVLGSDQKFNIQLSHLKKIAT